MYLQHLCVYVVAQPKKNTLDVSDIKGSRRHCMCWYKMSQRKSTVTSQPSAIHIFTSTKQATCEPRAASSPPTQSTLASPPYLSEHPRHRDEISHFWHFSAKSSMGAKIKRSERAGLSGCPLTLSVSEQQTAGTLCAPILLAWAKSTASRQSTG